MVRPLFSPRSVFVFSRNPQKRFWGLVFWYLWIGRAKNPGPDSSQHLSLEVLNVGGWLTHSDLALDTEVDFLAVTEHRLIPARVRSEWARLKAKGVASVWALASQDASHVGNAGVGVVSLKAPLALPACATAQFRTFFDHGRVVRCTLPLGTGRFMHLVVVYGYQGAATDPEQLALTDQLFDAALAELSVVARGQPCLMVGDFNVEPTKIPCLAKGISAGLWVDLEGSWALAIGRQPSSTCRREWGSVGGTRRDFIVGCPLLTAAVLDGAVQLDRWIAPHLAVRAFFDYSCWSCLVTQPVRFSPLWPAFWLLAIDKSRGLSRLRFVGSGKFMMIVCSTCPSVMLFFWMRAWKLEMFLGLGWCGLMLLSLLLLMLILFQVVHVPVMVLFLAVVLLVFGGFDLVAVEFVWFVEMLLMFMMLLMSSCIVMPLLLLCLI